MICPLGLFVVVVVESIASTGVLLIPQFIFYNEQQLSAFFRRENEELKNWSKGLWPQVKLSVSFQEGSVLDTRLVLL